MTEDINYEAIGRCKILKEEINDLEERQRRIAQMMHADMQPLTKSVPGVVPVVNRDGFLKQAKKIEALSQQLRIKLTSSPP